MIVKNPLVTDTRYMAIRLILDQGQFPSAPDGTGAPQNVKTIMANSDRNSLTVEVNITKASGWQQNSAYVVIYGMTIADCNAFTQFNQDYPLILFNNRIQIYAGYQLSSNGLPPLIYEGQVYTAAPDFNNPSRPFNIVSLAGIYNQNLISDTTNPSGEIGLNNLFQSIVDKSPDDLIYQSLGVEGNAECPIYTGSWLSQLQQACTDYGYQMRLDDNKILISPLNSPYSDLSTELSFENGMLGYPTIVELGADVRCRFNPTIQFGQKITIKSTLQSQANGEWYINGLAHTLHNRGPKWESVLKLNRFAFLSGGQ